MTGYKDGAGAGKAEETVTIEITMATATVGIMAATHEGQFVILGAQSVSQTPSRGRV